MSPVVKSLHVYPVKSGRGFELSEALVLDRGFQHDRSWLIVNRAGLAITQRDNAILALLNPEVIAENAIRLSAPGMSELVVERKNDGALLTVRVWDDECIAIDQGEAAEQWLSQFLNMDCKLVSMKDDFVRPVNAKYASAEQQVGFADGFPFLLISEASLEDLNSKLEAPVLMNRFRPNIVVSDCAAFDEDRWKRIRIGGICFDIVKPCARCVIVTIDQEDAVLGKEPMRTLSAYRKVGNKVMFGQNLVHDKTGVIRVGDLVEILG